MGDRDYIGGGGNIRGRGSTGDKRSLVVISVIFIILLSHTLRNYRYLNN